MTLNERIHESLTEVYLMSDKAISDIIYEIRQDVLVLYKASECIAMLDLLLSLSHLCSLESLGKFYYRKETSPTRIYGYAGSQGWETPYSITPPRQLCP